MLIDPMTEFTQVDTPNPAVSINGDGEERPVAVTPAPPANSNLEPTKPGAVKRPSASAAAVSTAVMLCEEDEIRAWCRRVTASNGFADFP